jgi:hypothetical protein
MFAHEPLPATSPLWSLPNVIATPHSAGFSDGNAARVVDIFLDNFAVGWRVRQCETCQPSGKWEGGCRKGCKLKREVADFQQPRRGVDMHNIDSRISVATYRVQACQ